MMLRFMKRQLRYWQLYLLALIPFTLVLLFNYMPMYGILLAFKDYSIKAVLLQTHTQMLKAFANIFIYFIPKVRFIFT